MRRAALFRSAMASVMLLAGPLAAQELIETFCEGEPRCSDDNLSIAFSDDSGNIFEYAEFAEGMTIEATVRMDTKSSMVQGWSYSVVHAERDVEIDGGLTNELTGTDAQAVIEANAGGQAFIRNELAAGTDDGGNPAVGFFSAVVLDLSGGAVMAAKDNSIYKINYKLLRDVGEDGTILRLADAEIGAQGALSSVVISICDNGRLLAPRFLTHGLIRRAPAGVHTFFRRGDCNGDGVVDLSDAVCVLNWLFAGDGRPGCVAATNANGDDTGNITDAAYLLNHLFAGGPAPVAPFLECGPGTLPADQELGCANPAGC